ncbi:unnamed protein product, partial [Schistosoma mattheei]
PSAGASRVDLLSVDNRQGSLPHLAAYSIHNTGGISEREQKLQNELLNTQRELQHLKRSRSLTGDQNLTHSTTLKQTLKSGSSQYLNDGFWTTYSLKKNEGQPCGARIAVTSQLIRGITVHKYYKDVLVSNDKASDNTNSTGHNL